MQIYVVAYEYEGGGGFDWYVEPSIADREFGRAKTEADKPALAARGWTVALYEYEASPTATPDEITAEIDSQCCVLFAAATTKYTKAA